MKVLYLVPLLAATALAQSSQCKREFVESSQCFTRKADELVRRYRYDAKSMSDCINRMSKSCTSVITNTFGQGINEVPPETMKQCAKESMKPAKEETSQCMKSEGYGGYQDAGHATEKEGVKVIGMLGAIKIGEKTCRALENCLPPDFADFKRDLCNSKAQCFPQSVKSKCPNMEKELQNSVCKCYKGLKNKDAIVDEFKACIGKADQNFLAKIGTRFTSRVLLKEVEKDVCRNDYTDKYDICEDSSFGKDAANNNPDAQPANNAFGRLLGGGNTGNLFGSRGGSNLFGGNGGGFNFGNFGRK